MDEEATLPSRGQPLPCAQSQEMRRTQARHKIKRIRAFIKSSQDFILSLVISYKNFKRFKQQQEEYKVNQKVKSAMVTSH
jgi:hypothetical protein